MKTYYQSQHNKASCQKSSLLSNKNLTLLNLLYKQYLQKISFMEHFINSPSQLKMEFSILSFTMIIPLKKLFCCLSDKVHLKINVFIKALYVDRVNLSISECKTINVFKIFSIVQNINLTLNIVQLVTKIQILSMEYVSSKLTVGPFVKLSAFDR